LFFLPDATPRAAFADAAASRLPRVAVCLRALVMPSLPLRHSMLRVYLPAQSCVDVSRATVVASCVMPRCSFASSQRRERSAGRFTRSDSARLRSGVAGMI